MRSRDKGARSGPKRFFRKSRPPYHGRQPQADGRIFPVLRYCAIPPSPDDRHKGTGRELPLFWPDDSPSLCAVSWPSIGSYKGARYNLAPAQGTFQNSPFRKGKLRGISKHRNPEIPLQLSLYGLVAKQSI